MASTIRYVLEDYWNQPNIGDPRSVGYPLMSNLGPLLTIITTYVLVVKWIGPWLMRDRKPFDLRGIILFYNLTNIVANLYFYVSTLKMTNYGRELLNFKRQYNDGDNEFTRLIILNEWLY